MALKQAIWWRVLQIYLFLCRFFTMLSTTQITQCWIIRCEWLMNWKGCGKKLPWSNSGTILAFFWRNWGKPWNISVRMLVFGPRFELGTSRTWSRSVNHLTVLSVINTKSTLFSASLIIKHTVTDTADFSCCQWRGDMNFKSETRLWPRPPFRVTTTETSF
jgi:hypothetical protein